MNKQIEALKMAIEALDESMPLVFGNGIALEMMKTPLLEVEQKVNFHKKAINACKEALAEAEKKEWQSLSDDEINEYWYQSNNDVEGVRLGFTTQQHYFARAIEQALKEKNHV